MPKVVDTTEQTIRAGFLAWIVPGLGHIMLGQRGLGIVLAVAISVPYLFGALVGGVKESISPRVNGWLFLAECGVGGFTVGGWLLSSSLPTSGPNEVSPYVSYYPESDVAQIYLATAGLLNILAILDAMARASSGGAPTFAREAAADTPTMAAAGAGAGAPSVSAASAPTADGGSPVATVTPTPMDSPRDAGGGTST